MKKKISISIFTHSPNGWKLHWITQTYTLFYCIILLLYWQQPPHLLPYRYKSTALATLALVESQLWQKICVLNESRSYQDDITSIKCVFWTPNTQSIFFSSNSMTQSSIHALSNFVFYSTIFDQMRALPFDLMIFLPSFQRTLSFTIYFTPFLLSSPFFF